MGRSASSVQCSRIGNSNPLFDPVEIEEWSPSVAAKFYGGQEPHAPTDGRKRHEGSLSGAGGSNGNLSRLAMSSWFRCAAHEPEWRRRVIATCCSTTS
jgi:hypothetical protein